jgi:hypothetical protein
MPFHSGLNICALVSSLRAAASAHKTEDIHAASDDGDDDAMELLDHTMQSSWLFGPFSPLIVLTLAFGTVLGVAAKYSTTAVDFVVGYAPQYQVQYRIFFAFGLYVFAVSCVLVNILRTPGSPVQSRQSGLVHSAGIYCAVRVADFSD